MNFIAKLMGLDLNRSYTDEELDAFKARWNEVFRQMIVSTFVLCSGMILTAWVYQSITAILK